MVRPNGTGKNARRAAMELKRLLARALKAVEKVHKDELVGRLDFAAAKWLALNLAQPATQAYLRALLVAFEAIPENEAAQRYAWVRAALSPTGWRRMLGLLCQRDNAKAKAKAKAQAFGAERARQVKALIPD